MGLDDRCRVVIHDGLNLAPHAICEAENTCATAVADCYALRPQPFPRLGSFNYCVCNEGI
jgi:hypothetical protein